MAKKDEGLTYLQVPLPKEYKKSKFVKKTWHGYNRKRTVDTGMLSKEYNISTEESPYLVPSPSEKRDGKTVKSIHGIFGFGNDMFVLYALKNGDISLFYHPNYPNHKSTDVKSRILYSSTSASDFKPEDPRCIVQFNHFATPTNPAESTYEKRFLLFPDKKSIHFDDEGKMTVTSINGMPDIKYATVHLSRLFGVDDVRIYASGFNDYANWNTDTATEYNEANAWCSASGSNTKAGGIFTGITTYQNHVVCFKKDFMHEIYNTKNPFRIQDIYAEGCVDNRSIQDVDGRLIFVSDDAVKVYSGSNPRIISYCLGVREFKEAIAGSDGRNYYLYCVDENNIKHLFVYDTYCGEWSERSIEQDRRVVGFALVGGKVFYAYNTGDTENDKHGIVNITTDQYLHDWYFETDLITNESGDIKHIEKFQMFCDINNGSKLDIYFLYDNEEFDKDTSHKVFGIENNAGKDVQKVIRVKPRMTAHYGFKVHVEGNGFVRIRSMELLIRGGGDLYV